MKKKVFYLSMSLFLTLVFTGCDETNDMTALEAGKKAGDEFCDCRKDNSESTCLEKLNKDYGRFVASDDFYTGANESNPCGYNFFKVVK